MKLKEKVKYYIYFILIPEETSLISKAKNIKPKLLNLNNYIRSENNDENPAVIDDKPIILIEDIFEYEINDNSQFAVVASDGIWEFLSNEEVCRIILPFYQKNDIKGAIEKLFYEAIRLWKEVYLLLSS